MLSSLFSMFSFCIGSLNCYVFLVSYYFINHIAEREREREREMGKRKCCFAYFCSNCHLAVPVLCLFSGSLL